MKHRERYTNSIQDIDPGTVAPLFYYMSELLGRPDVHGATASMTVTFELTEQEHKALEQWFASGWFSGFLRHGNG